MYFCENEKYESYKKLSPKDDDEETKTNFNKEKAACKTKFLYFTCVFINYHCIIDLLPFYNTKLK